MIPRALLCHAVTCASALLALLLIGIIIGASFIAAADPPDPAWLSGYYDADDEDEVLALVWDHSSATIFSIRIPFGVGLSPAQHISLPLSAGFAVARSFHSRAPPLA